MLLLENFQLALVAMMLRWGAGWMRMLVSKDAREAVGRALGAVAIEAEEELAE